MEPGTFIADRYRLDGLIAWGGMGAVWRGFDTRLDREVGIKLLHRGLEEAQNPHDRFEREAKTLASLKGPGFVEVYDYGDDRHGDQAVWFIVMELVEGVSLAELLHQRERLSPDRTMKIVAESAEALEAAHRRGVVHRDIKPANILVDTDDRVRVIDFGISKMSGGPKLTSTDAVLGTAAYVSPEQLRKDEVTGAADLYALGVVAFECLTGAPPFDSVDREVISHDHLWTPPPPLPDEIPADVAAVVARSLNKSPADRWESAGELAQACRAAMRGEPSPWTPPPAAEGEGAQEPVTPSSPERAPLEAAAQGPAGPPTRKERSDGLWSWRFGFVTVTVIALLLLAGLFAWSPWDQSDRPLADESTTSAAETAAEGEDPEESASVAESDAPEEEETGESPEDGGGETVSPSGGDDGESDSEGDSNGGSGSSNDDDQPESGSAELPDVTGMTTFQARDELAEAGFENAVASVGYYWYTPEPEHCTVMQQSPSAGTTVEYSKQITLSYHERQAEGTSCEW